MDSCLKWRLYDPKYSWRLLKERVELNMIWHDTRQQSGYKTNVNVEEPCSVFSRCRDHCYTDNPLNNIIKIYGMMTRSGSSLCLFVGLIEKLINLRLEQENSEERCSLWQGTTNNERTGLWSTIILYHRKTDQAKKNLRWVGKQWTLFNNV